eukprot:4582397-Prymnesium_polylepis.3
MTPHNLLATRWFPAEAEDLARTGALHMSTTRHRPGHEICWRPGSLRPGSTSETLTRRRCSLDRSKAICRQLCLCSTGHRLLQCLAGCRCPHIQISESTGR